MSGALRAQRGDLAGPHGIELGANDLPRISMRPLAVQWHRNFVGLAGIGAEPQRLRDMPLCPTKRAIPSSG